MEHLWIMVRQPFYVINCLSPRCHKWEPFDCDAAGCTACGAIHRCCTNVFMNTSCPLEEQIDSSFTCTITGLSIPCIRTAPQQYIDHCSFAPTVDTSKPSPERTENEVACILHTFFSSAKMMRCKARENQKRLAKLNVAAIKVLKQKKASQQHKFPNLIEVITETMHLANVQYSTLPSHALIQKSAMHIAKCIHDMEITRVLCTRPRFIIGVLYLMKTGLCINNSFWLPKIPQLLYCLPHENFLEKYFGYSIKIICETENEIKLFLRQKMKLL